MLEQISNKSVNPTWQVCNGVDSKQATRQVIATPLGSKTMEQ